MRKVDGWEALYQPIELIALDLAAGLGAPSHARTPPPEKCMTPIGSTSPAASFGLNGAALACFASACLDPDRHALYCSGAAGQISQILEHDHRFIKRITGPMMGFKAFHSAAATIAGIEAAHMIRKWQISANGASAFQTFAALSA